jgi:Uma2 family endonuclease
VDVCPHLLALSAAMNELEPLDVVVSPTDTEFCPPSDTSYEIVDDQLVILYPRPADEVDDLRAKPDISYEIVDDQVVELDRMSATSGRLGFRLAHSLEAFAAAHQRGQGVMDVLFPIRLEQKKKTMRKPDAAYVSFARWPANKPVPDSDPWPVVPEIAAEVISPTDKALDVRLKVPEYFAAGVLLVWIVWPALRVVDVFTSPTQVTVLTDADTLTGGAALPGFTLALNELFGPVPEST